MSAPEDVLRIKWASTYYCANDPTTADAIDAVLAELERLRESGEHHLEIIGKMEAINAGLRERLVEVEADKQQAETAMQERGAELASLRAFHNGLTSSHKPEDCVAYCDSLRERLAAWEREVGAEMPADFKDWYQNSPDEHPLVTRLVLKGRREQRAEIREALRKLARQARLQRPSSLMVPLLDDADDLLAEEVE